MEPAWDVGMKICSNVTDRMTKIASRPILKNSFFRTKSLMTLKLEIQHQVLKYYQICSNDDTRLTLVIFYDMVKSVS